MCLVVVVILVVLALGAGRNAAVEIALVVAGAWDSRPIGFLWRRLDDSRLRESAERQHGERRKVGIRVLTGAMRVRCGFSQLLVSLVVVLVAVSSALIRHW